MTTMADRPGQRAQWWFAGSLIVLLAILATFYLFARLPASSYVDAMAKGQYLRASKLLQPEVDDNDPQARNALGNLYYLGMGVERNYRDAALLYHAAATSRVRSRSTEPWAFVHAGTGGKQER